MNGVEIGQDDTAESMGIGDISVGRIDVFTAMMSWDIDDLAARSDVGAERLGAS